MAAARRWAVRVEKYTSSSEACTGVKLASGGLVDLEFVVHFHQLASGIGLEPHLPTAIEALAGAGLVQAELGAAHDLLTRLIVTLRLVAPGMEAPGIATQ